MTRAALAALGVLACAGCPRESARFCNTVLDCFTFERCVDGICAPPLDTDGGSAQDAGATVDGGTDADAGGTASDAGGADAGASDAGAAVDAGGGGPTPTTCAELHAADPGKPSGVYPFPTAGVGGFRDVECDMATDGGGWALVFRYNEGSPCPSGWASAPRGCQRPTDAPQAATFALAPYAYTEMRGEVRALAFGVSDAFRDNFDDVNTTFVDGVVISVGNPRRHIFTFADGETDAFPANVISITSECPCAGGTGAPPFVGADFLCEEPRDSFDVDGGARFYDETDVLFDGLDVDDPACLGAPESAPSFRTSLPRTTDAVELRLMSNDASSNEDTAVIHVELWVR